MKLQIGQRWQCSDPKCLIEILQIKYKITAHAVILQSDNKYFPIGTKHNFYEFPCQDDVDNNRYWQYLHGQDKPL